MPVVQYYFKAFNKNVFCQLRSKLFLRVCSTDNLLSFIISSLSLEHLTSRVSVASSEFICFFVEVSNFREIILTNQKMELVIRNCQWNCMLKHFSVLQHWLGLSGEHYAMPTFFCSPICNVLTMLWKHISPFRVTSLFLYTSLKHEKPLVFWSFQWV